VIATNAPQFERTLPRDPLAPSMARRSVERWFEEAVAPFELETIKLLADELVTNAVLHGTGKITLRGRLDREEVRVEVIDEGHGFDPGAGRRNPDGAGGHGLMIVDSESSRWGVYTGTTHVWFAVERSRA
jgi:serine/threonine-protein kinase RsbW